MSVAPAETSIVHIAGHAVQVGVHLRQRCSWCGAVLIDEDLTRVAVEAGTDPRPATWPVGELVRTVGVMSSVLDHEDGAQLPGDACAALDPDVTV